MTARKPPCARGKSCPCICHDGFGGAHPHRRCDEGQPNVSMLPHRLGTTDADTVNYTYPVGHPLHRVPIEVLKAARHVLLDAADWKDVDPGLALPIADAVVLVLLPWLDPAKVIVERCVNCDQPIRRCENADSGECVFKGWRHLDGQHSCTSVTTGEHVACPKIEFVDVTQDVDNTLQPTGTAAVDDDEPIVSMRCQAVSRLRVANGRAQVCQCLHEAYHSGTHECGFDRDHVHLMWNSPTESTVCAFESTTSGLRPNNVVCTCAHGGNHVGPHECLQGRNHLHTTWVNPEVNIPFPVNCQYMSNTQRGTASVVCGCTGAAGHTGEHACAHGRKHVHVVWINPNAETFPSEEERR